MLASTGRCRTGSPAMHTSWTRCLSGCGRCPRGWFNGWGRRCLVVPSQHVPHQGHHVPRVPHPGRFNASQLRTCNDDYRIGGPFTVRSRRSTFPRSIRTLALFHLNPVQLTGIHLKVVSGRLGHGTIGIFGDLYSHVVPSVQVEAVRRFESEVEKRDWQKNGKFSSI